MKKTALALALSTLAIGAVNAHPTGNWTNSAGENVKTGTGDCLLTILNKGGECEGAQKKMSAAEADALAAAAAAKAAKDKAMSDAARLRAQAEAARRAAAAKATAGKKAALESLKRIKLGSGATFATGSSRLSAAGRAELDGLAAKIKKVGSGLQSVVVEGHTDSRGAAAFNQRLSQQRANSVKSYLATKGIPAAKITAKGFGESQPIATNETATGRAENRRVIVKVEGDIVERIGQ